MCLACEDEQDGSLVVADDALQPLQVFEQQGRTLVGGEAPGEPDGQHLGIGRVGELEEAVEMRLGATIAEVLACDAKAHQMQHPRLERLAHAPEKMVGDLVHPAPESDVGNAVAPVEPEVALEHFCPFLRQESGHVHAIGDVVDAVVLGVDLRPQPSADARRDPAMDAAHAVLEARAVARQHGHVEVLLAGAASQPHELLAAHAHFGTELLEIAPDHLLGKVIVTCRHRRMSGEHGVGGDAFQCTAVIQALRRELAHALQDEEGGMSLVDVPYGRLALQFFQDPHAAHAEHDFLLDAHAAVAAVELMGDPACVLVVLLEVGVEQEQLDVAAARTPHLARHATPRQFHEDLERARVVVHDG